MSEMQRSALIVGVDPADFQRLATRLRRSGFVADFVSTGEEALDLVSLLPFDAVIVAYPVIDVATKSLLGAIRKVDGPCRGAAVVLLAPDEWLDEATGFVGQGANLVLPRAGAAELLPVRMQELIEVAPRHPLRVLSRLRGRLAGTTALCQTENISTSGMLLRGDQHVAVGFEVHFELTLPGDAKPLRGTGLVVRHTFEKRERVSGLGIRFLSFEDDGSARLQVFLASLPVS